MRDEAAGLARIRREYESFGIDPATLLEDPLAQLQIWLQEAIDASLIEPNAMVLATVDATGIPRTRHVLAKGIGGGGVEFYTNYNSAKATSIGDHGLVSATFGWLELNRQVTIVGTATRVAAAESDAYFAMRPRDAQLGAWSSHQSKVISDRMILDHAFDAADERFPNTVPRPPHWGGYRIVPTEFEFWQGRPNRLHDRVRYRGVNTTEWFRERLSP